MVPKGDLKMKAESKTVRMHAETHQKLLTFLPELRTKKQADRLTFDDAILALLEDHYQWAA